MLGGVVDILAKHANKTDNNFTEEIRRPALRLAVMYGLQVGSLIVSDILSHLFKVMILTGGKSSPVVIAWG